MPEPEINPLVAALSRDGGPPESCVVMTGFLGKTGDGRFRLYSTATLDDCVEFAAEDLLHSATISESGLPVSMVWVRRDATVQHISRMTAESSFLQGDIAGDLLEGSPGDASQERIIGTIIRTISRLLCSSRRCPSRTGPCTVRSLCNTCTALPR
jgi:hypothetical protein